MRTGPTPLRPMLLPLLMAAVLGSAMLPSGCGEAMGVSRPDLTLRDLDGGTLSLADLEGKAVLLNFWFLG